MHGDIDIAAHNSNSRVMLIYMGATRLAASLGDRGLCRMPLIGKLPQGISTQDESEVRFERHFQESA